MLLISLLKYLSIVEVLRLDVSPPPLKVHWIMPISHVVDHVIPPNYLSLIYSADLSYTENNADFSPCH